MDCLICREIIDLPHSLPCTHIFCYICIKRHLLERHFCPICYSGPFYTCSLNTAIQYNSLPNISINFNIQSDYLLNKELKKRNLSIENDRIRKNWRLKEYKLIYEGEQLRELPKSPTSIVRMVHVNERSVFKKEEEVCMSKIKDCIFKLKKEINDIRNSK